MLQELTKPEIDINKTAKSQPKIHLVFGASKGKKIDSLFAVMELFTQYI